MKKLAIALQAAVLFLAASPGYAETAHVKYRGDAVNLRKFECHNVANGSEVRRVCFDRANGYMVIKLVDTYYHYCEIDAPTVRGLWHAPAPDDYYHASIRGRFDCRTHRVPKN